MQVTFTGWAYLSKIKNGPQQRRNETTQFGEYPLWDGAKDYHAMAALPINIFEDLFWVLVYAK
eukprot:6012488-Ditylum_brightwellii.AAC.2